MAIEFDKYKLLPKWAPADYLGQLGGLLPRGIIWTASHLLDGAVLQDVVSSGDEIQDVTTGSDIIQDVTGTEMTTGSLFRRLLSVFASELQRLEVVGWDVVNATDPGVADELLSEWERVLGLPEACYDDLVLTLDERQRYAHSKLFDRMKTATRQWYIDFAANLGWTITIQEIPFGSSPRIVGDSRVGPDEPRMGGREGNFVIEITIVSGVGNVELLKCAINEAKPLHIVIAWVGP